LQHVLDAHEWLRARGVVNLQLADQCHRHFQVLAGSTHPLMQQPVSGGYLLSGVKVEQPPGSGGAVAARSKK
jgi:hypothetical protein